MSKLSDFFPKGVSQGNRVNVVMIGGGGGAGYCGGAAGGGYFYGSVPVIPGVSYPVTIGTGGSPGNPASCATTAGLGNPGSPSKFGRYEALGGGGGSTFNGTLSGSAFFIPGSPGGHGGSSCGRLSIPCPCGALTPTEYLLNTGASQRSVSPDAYCGALGVVSKYCIDTCKCLFGCANLRRTCSATSICPEFFGVCLASIPYTFSPAPTIPTLTTCCLCTLYGACTRLVDWQNGCTPCPFAGANTAIGNCPNTGNGALCPACNGDSGVVLVAYPCVLPAATSFPGAVDCSPVSIPQNGYRTYKFTSSGSFTL